MRERVVVVIRSVCLLVADLEGRCIAKVKTAMNVKKI